MLAGCRHDEMVIPSETDEIGGITKGLGGLYLLNEGNMGSNKCTIDYYDFSSGEYHRNIYPERNPNEVMELGDVGNDMAIYGSRLYVVVNCSHKMEILDARTGVKLGKVDIPNCRFVKFHDGNAYVSSYIGPVGADPNCPLGAVFRVDTLSMTITGEVAVGYQPEEMEIVDGTLFVANSGGYRPPEYDRTISAINLDTFTLDYTIDADINLFRLRKDNYGRLWATSRGNNADIQGKILMLQRGEGESRYKTARSLPVKADNICLRGDSLLYISSDRTFGAIDVRTGAQLGNFISDGTDSEITHPYGLAVHPKTGDIFITDAKNYVSSGTLYCIDGNGHKRWSARTGDIPSAIAFTDATLDEHHNGTSPSDDLSAYISKVYEFHPAPGQFVNETPIYEEGDTYRDILRKCEEAICGKNEGTVSLGGFGGYIIFGFDHLVENVEGEKDFLIKGNCVWQSDEIRGGSAEPGIVYVSYDANGNGLPDDEWYELAGSEYNSPETIHNYTVTYYRPGATPSSALEEYIRWEDNTGNSGWMPHNTYHLQSYWPGWNGEETLTFSGTRLAPNAVDVSGNGSNFVLYSYPWGYADNYPNRFEDENSFDISWAVDEKGQPVRLPGIHFIKVQTGMHQQCGWTGESSTEIVSARDLHR